MFARLALVIAPVFIAVSVAAYMVSPILGVSMFLGTVCGVALSQIASQGE